MHRVVYKAMSLRRGAKGILWRAHCFILGIRIIGGSVRTGLDVFMIRELLHGIRTVNPLLWEPICLETVDAETVVVRLR